MINVSNVNSSGVNMTGLSISLPSGESHAEMLLIFCKKGYIMCGYLNMAASDKFEDTAVIISGNSLEELLNNPVKAVSQKAEALGIKIGMTGAEAAAIMNE